MIVEPASKPGSYEVRVTATQGGGSVERTLAYTLAAK